jgi:hypothetical protein
MITMEQTREYTRGKKLQDFLTLNHTVYVSFQPFDDEVNDFSQNFMALDALMPQKRVVSSGITTDKRGMKQNVAAALALICRKTMAYAIRYNNPQLAAQSNTREDVIFRMKDGSLLPYVKAIITLVQPLLGVVEYTPYGITQAVLDAVLADAQDFNSMIGTADVMASGGTVANTAINKAIDKLRQNIKQFDLLVDEFAVTNPDFVQGYQINTALDNTGIRHSGIEGSVHNKDGKVITGATVQLEGTTKAAVTDLNGFYRIDHVLTDDYNVICTAPDYTSQTVLHHVTRGKVDELNFVL